ncbi:uncharacterized protein LOC116301932 [Actinia tenebrosa]|uniref:Uncharacterized protein LOC116301932 n=1 Tax=Actinia tenebrosa TaxID=6105 RepID=A0A6P8IJP1_ACTTE|nr:uncharacterized protein LOC116301932 [Actinia tenebrosa]
MKGLQILSLLLCLTFVLSAPNSYVDNDEQRFIDYLSTQGSHQGDVLHDKELMDELEREKMTIAKQHDDGHSKDDQKYHLIKKSAVAVVQRMSMPSPPALDVLIDKAVHYVMKKTMVREYVQIRSGIKELVDKMLHRNLLIEDEEHAKKKIKSSPTSAGLREERIVLAMEEIIQELAIRLNLTTMQTKKVVDISVKVLAKHRGLNSFQREELHERVTSQVRKMLDIEDEDNKDARLRRLEERIEKNIEKYKLSAKQVKTIEGLMVEEEAVEEGLTKEERVRMLKRVYADVIDDLRAQRNEQKIKPPNLNDVQLTAINHLIRQKAIELQLNKEEIKVLGLAILTAVEHLSRNLKPTQQPHTEINPDVATAIPTTTTNKLPTTMKTTEQKTVKTESLDKLVKEEKLENEKPTKRVTHHKDPTTHAQKTQSIISQRIPTTHAPEAKPKTSQRTTTAHAHETKHRSTQKIPTTHAHETFPKSTQPSPTAHARETKPTSQRRLVKEGTDLDAKLLQDEAELEGKDSAKNVKMDQETKAEELELILERRAQDKEESQMKTKQSSTMVPTSTKVIETTKYPDEVVTSKPTESRHTTQRVTQATEKITEKAKPTIRAKKITKPVARKVTSVTQSKESKLSKERLEEELLEGHVLQPSKSHVTQPKNYVPKVTQPKIHVTDETQPKKEHITAAKPTEDFAKELKNIIEKKPIHSRKNHELLQDEVELEDLEIRKNKTQHDTTLENELKLAANLFKKKKKQNTLDEELNEVLKAKDLELEKLEEELEGLKP